MLYLFKTARRPLYRQQNLHLLAAERGTVVELAWNRAWVTADCYDAGSIPPGAAATCVLTDRPYTHFVPVRAAEVIEARWEDTSLRLWLALGGWVRAPAADVPAFTRALRGDRPEQVPGEKFVMLRDDDLPPRAFHDDDEASGWRAAVDDVLTMSAAAAEPPYPGSVFFRAAGVRVAGELHLARREPLARGEDAELLVESYNPHLDAAVLAQLAVQAVPVRDTLKVSGAVQLTPDGTSTLRVKALSDAPELSLLVQPHPLQHTMLTLRFPPARAAGPVGHLGPEQAAQVRQVYEIVRRNVRGEPARELAVLDAFVTLLPDETALHERRAVLLARTGDDASSYELLRTLEPERLHDDARFLLFAQLARRGAAAQAASLWVGVDLHDGDRLPRLLHELDALEPPVLDRTVRELVGRLADEADLLDMLQRTAHRLTSPELIADVGRTVYIATDDARRAAALVNERRRALRLSHPVIADVLIELAEAGAGDEELSDVLGHRIANLIERDDIEEAMQRLRQATPVLPRQERDRLYHRTADRLEARERGEAAATLLVELAYAALRTGDLHSATDAVERATGMTAAAGGPVPGWLTQANARAQRAWSEFEDLAEWRTTDRERRRQKVHDAFRHRSILVVGGLKRDGQQERLRELTGAEVDFGEHFRGAGDSLESLAQRIRAGRYALVIFRWMFAGHEVSDRLRAVCQEAGVPWEWAPSGGIRGLEEALWTAARQLETDQP